MAACRSPIPPLGCLFSFFLSAHRFDTFWEISPYLPIPGHISPYMIAPYLPTFPHIPPYLTRIYCWRCETHLPTSQNISAYVARSQGAIHNVARATPTQISPYITLSPHVCTSLEIQLVVYRAPCGGGRGKEVEDRHVSRDIHLQLPVYSRFPHMHADRDERAISPNLPISPHISRHLTEICG